MDQESGNRQRVALITGASSGFGLVTAIAMAEEGYRVIATMRDPRKRDKLLAAALQAGVEESVSVSRLDVTDHENVSNLVGDVLKTYGSIDVLVNNAGIAVGGFVEELEMAAWREQMETNVFGVLALIGEVLPSMRENRRGLIVNISSISGRVGFPGYAPYAASKFAIEGLSEALRHEMLPYGVKVVLVEPGAYNTAIWEKGFEMITQKPNSPYAKQLDAVLDFSRKAAASAPEPAEVARKIAAIATMKRPKLRYAMGKGARASLWGKSLLPWRMFEMVIYRLLNKK
ncbi:SDR family oxidoreductase [Paenibacillaceae bacterium]|nr:SDR family oxidoreductase [Paenibacillaceae bacterium]